MRGQRGHGLSALAAEHLDSSCLEQLMPREFMFRTIHSNVPIENSCLEQLLPRQFM